MKYSARMMCLWMVWNAVLGSTLASDAKGLRWDATQKTVAVDSKATNASVVFRVTNHSARVIHIVRLKPSCGCTTAGNIRLPIQLSSEATQSIRFDTDVTGKRGILNKSAEVFSSQGVQVLKFRLAIGLREQAMSRRGNQVLAAADRQAVFQGKCAECHARPTQGKHGRDLFAAACGICHEAEHRASMVPDLSAHQLKPEQWEALITKGKPNSLMPAFHQDERGPLAPEQIESLVEFLIGRSTRTDATGSGRRDERGGGGEAKVACPVR